jgi:hypothetical protein
LLKISSVKVLSEKHWSLGFWTIYRVQAGTLTSGTHRKAFRWYDSIGYKKAGTSSWKVESTRLWHFWISDPALLIKDGCGSCHWTRLIFNKPSIFSIKNCTSHLSTCSLTISVGGQGANCGLGVGDNSSCIWFYKDHSWGVGGKEGMVGGGEKWLKQCMHMWINE